MFLWKWFLCVAFLSVVLSDTVPEGAQSEEIKNEYQHSVENQLKSLENTDLAKLFPDYKEKLNDLLKQLSSTTSEKEKVAILNDFTDICLVNLNRLLMELGVDPLPLDDLITGFEFVFLFIKYWAEIGLRNGWLQGVGSMKRHSDVTLTYKELKIKIHSPMKFEALRFNYDYVIKFMGIGPSGGLDGSVDGCRYTFDLTIDLRNLSATLDSFKLDTLGKVNLKFNGYVWFDWFVNLCVKFTIPAVTPILRLVIEVFVSVLLNGMCDMFNGMVCKVLDDCPLEFVGPIL